MNAVATLRTRSAGLRRGGRMFFALVLALGGAVAAEAIVAKSPTPLDAKTLYHPAFHQAGSGQALATIVDRIPNGADWQRFLDTHGEQMVVADPVTGRVVSVSGTGIPWIPGLGNTLTMADLVGVTSGPKAAPGLPELETIARNFVASNDALFRIPADMSLALNSDASLEVSPSMWALRFDLSWKGIPIDGGAISFVVKHGNLVLWGATGLDDVGLGGGFAIGATRALALVGDYVGGFLPGVDTVVGDPRRVLVPERLSATDGYRSVWEIRFEREGEGSYLARVDASTGEILEFHDDNDYAQIKGGSTP